MVLLLLLCFSLVEVTSLVCTSYVRALLCYYRWTVNFSLFSASFFIHTYIYKIFLKKINICMCTFIKSYVSPLNSPDPIRKTFKHWLHEKQNWLHLVEKLITSIFYRELLGHKYRKWCLFGYFSWCEMERQIIFIQFFGYIS